MVRTILISYDLITPGKDYEKLFSYLRTYKSCKPLYSVWVLKTNESYTVIRDEASAFVDPNDKLLVVDITNDAAAWKSLSSEIGAWLRENI